MITEYLQHYLPRERLLTTDADSLVSILNEDSTEKSRTLLEKLRLDMQRNYHLLFTFGLAPRHHTPSAEDATDLSAVQNIYIALFCGNENISESCG